MGSKSAAAALAASLLALAGVSAPIAAATPAVPLDHLPALSGGYFPLQSSEADHLYHIYVRLPQDYEADAERRYPVVYLLDGDGLFPILAASHLFLTIDDKVPEAVIVGISYGSFEKPTNRRHIDFMPNAEGVAANEAGAAAFHAFLKNELLPAIERRYRVDPSRRILFGQSRGGAMILHSAFTDPDLFWARVASNASWKPGREIWFGPPPAAKRDDLQLIIATGTEEHPDRRRSGLDWFAHWNSRGKAPWTIRWIDVADGTHSANSVDAYRAAIRRLFAEEIAEH